MLIDKQDRAHFIQAFVNYLPDVAADRWGHNPALATQWVLCAFQFTGVWLYLENSSIFEPRDIKFSVYLHHSWDTVCISSCTIRYILSAMWRYSKFSQYLLTVWFFFFSPLFPHPPTHIWRRWQPPQRSVAASTLRHCCRGSLQQSLPRAIDQATSTS